MDLPFGEIGILARHRSALAGLRATITRSRGMSSDLGRGEKVGKQRAPDISDVLTYAVRR